MQTPTWARPNFSGADRIFPQLDRKTRLSSSLSCPTARLTSLPSLTHIRRLSNFTVGDAVVAIRKRRRSFPPAVGVLDATRWSVPVGTIDGWAMLVRVTPPLSPDFRWSVAILTMPGLRGFPATFSLRGKIATLAVFVHLATAPLINFDQS